MGPVRHFVHVAFGRSIVGLECSAFESSTSIPEMSGTKNGCVFLQKL